MAAKDIEVTRVKMTFPEKIIGEPIIGKLSRDLKVMPNILRGRITPDSAWLEIEISGPKHAIKKALRFLEEKGVTVSKI